MITEIRFGTDLLDLRLLASDGPVRVVGLTGPARSDGVFLVEVFHTAEAHGRTNLAWQTSAVGERLRYVSHEVTRTPDGAHRLTVVQRDPVTGLTATCELTARDGVAAVRAVTRVRNDGDTPVRLEAVTSLSLSVADAGRRDALDLYWARNEWLAECRWQHEPLARRLVMDVDVAAHGQDPRGRCALVGRGTWSTGEFLPVGVLVDRARGTAVAWQVEPGGPWSWEVTERRGAFAVTMTGPTDLDSAWSRVLAPGEEFGTVPATVAVSDAGVDGAFAALTAHRRATRRPHPHDGWWPVVYNDFMNTLMGEPSEEALNPLIDAAAEAGAEVFCIDAGWFRNRDEGMTLGMWQAATTRFTHGLDAVIDRIRDRGMVPGLWLEPEVVGVGTPIAESLPPEAFWSRGGIVLRDSGRIPLDLRHPAARALLDATVDDLVARYGIGYVKLDYNADFGTGTDRDADSAGDGLLRSQRALLDWLDGLHERHPTLLVENCASGGMRMDHAFGARTQIQSTSDQQSAVRTVPIAAAAATAVPPEQAGTWAYPQPEMSDEEVVLTLCNGLTGRPYLSGFWDRMTPERRAVVRAAVDAHRALRPGLGAALPWWPLGLPEWDDEWVAFGLRLPEGTALIVWHRPAADRSGPATVRIPVSASDVQHLFPATGALPGAGTGWSVTLVEGDPEAAQGAELVITTDVPEPSARMVLLR